MMSTRGKKLLNLGAGGWRWGLILMSSILGSAFVYPADSWANSAENSKVQTQQQAPRSLSVGESLLTNTLGADALRPINPPTQQNATGANLQPYPASNSATPGKGKPKMASVTMPKTVAQARTFPDVQGNWAQSFIEALAARNIIVGYPDGTFRPDAPVTRAEFAAMIRKAFAKQPIRAAVDFVDVPPNFWGIDAIQEAYQTGFLEGYPNRVFVPNQNIPRVQVLVSLISGLELSPTADVANILNTYFQDAAQIPDYARTAIGAATENQIVVNYPNVALLNPNQIASRADVAAFIYQALVRAGQLPPLGATDVASRYIVGYQPPIAEQPPDAEALRQRLRLPAPPLVERIRRILGGASSISTPTAFGADRNTVFLAASFQERTRNIDDEDGGIGIGIGLGDARKLVGAEVTLSIYDLFGDTFEDGGISFKIHRLLTDNLAIAVGVENFDTFGDPDPEYSSVYGAVSNVFPLGRPRESGFTPNVTATVGVGGGRFRSVGDLEDGDDGVNVFGSVGVRVAQPISLIAEWSGQDLNLGVSIAPFPNVPLVITPAVADVTGNIGDEPRFILGVGYGFRF